jgi:O-antigen/teichoic acid export membrane protein
VLVLFLTSLNLVFSPFAADLHARGELERLDELFKRTTRWALAATLPLLVVLFVAADDVMRAFSARFETGDEALRIMLVGQAVNVATGSVGFILIMAGFTGIDLLDNLAGVLVLAGLAIVLTAAFGIEGTAAASAISLAALNVVRLLQVRRRIGVQPYERTYLRLLIPTAGAALAALGLHALAADQAWWVSLAATGVGGVAAYGLLLPFALPAEERAALLTPFRGARPESLP